MRLATDFGNPFDFPAEKQDKNTADDELSPKTGGENSSFEQIGQVPSILQLSNKKI